ncbi:MAG: HvfC/BufC family peptide modification chaperone [Rhodanobacteraceae bacterium]
MSAAPSLPELQRQFMAALYDADAPGPVACIAGNGLTPEGRMRIYRRSCNEIHTAALRTSYPAVLALVGDAFFDQTARGYRRAYPSISANLQAFGAELGDYLETLTTCRACPYLPDVARLEWLRQDTILAPDAVAVPSDPFIERLQTATRPVRVVLHPSLRLFESRYPVVTIWHYALQPAAERLTLEQGERVALWREDREVAMAVLDPASFACITAMHQEATLDAAKAAAMALDSAFDLSGCIETLLAHGLITGTRPFVASHEESSPCRRPAS